MTIWCRVRDNVTGHHFDVSIERMQQLVDRGAAVEIVDGQHPARHVGRPCSPKPRRPLGTPAPQQRAAKAVAEPKESESS